MIEPKGDDIGRGVVYTGNRYPGGALEYGRIWSFNSACVFVLYDGDKHPQATYREDLEWAQRLPEPLTDLPERVAAMKAAVDLGLDVAALLPETLNTIQKEERRK